MGIGRPSIDTKLHEVERRIESACDRAGRSRGDVTLVGVSKKQPIELLREAYAAGLRDFGESYVQELAGRYEESSEFADQVSWHFIGHLQRNKVSTLIPLAEMVHSVDAERLAGSIEQSARELGTVVPMLLQVNTSGEASKYGCSPGGALTLAERIMELEHLELRGLMTLAAYSDDPEFTRPMFRLLRDTRDLVSERLKLDLPVLSMGMSNDFEVAIEEGSTIVRVGTAIFGERPSQPGVRKQ
jgi:hypothetical protein